MTARATLIILLCLALAPGCGERCYSDGPGIRLEIRLGQGLNGAALKTLVVAVTLGTVTRQEKILLAGRLADGETAVEVSLGDLVNGPFSAEVEVTALDFNGAQVASALQLVSADEDQCVIIHLTLQAEKNRDQGPADGGVDSIKKDLKNPKPDLKNPNPDLKVPKPDLPGPKPDLPKLDLPPPKPDLAKPDLPPPPPDMPPPPPDMPPPPPDMTPDLWPGPDIILGSH